MSVSSFRSALRPTLISLSLLAAFGLGAGLVAGHAGTIPSSVDGQALPSLAPMLERVTPAGLAPGYESELCPLLEVLRDGEERLRVSVFGCDELDDLAGSHLCGELVNEA